MTFCGTDFSVHMDEEAPSPVAAATKTRGQDGDKKGGADPQPVGAGSVLKTPSRHKDPVVSTHGSGGKGDPMVISSSEESGSDCSDFPDIEEYLNAEGNVDAASAGVDNPVGSGGDPMELDDGFLSDAPSLD
ncbi:uncharacterized protein B0T23DRAFT_428283 [Neurospora hispaniola]|uniref:Uncharacterized protein n=1 Tax=Neurospora hispaniola TaxID=588809 RepID=A0AAJ0IB85_9PEZI|nr:hypothetical protein B0T23DRAFT_428283 [Neurospora hispaniola]